MQQDNENDQPQPKQFISYFPAVDIANKHYSLEADIVTGWRPRNKIIGPIPLNFDSPLLDEIVDNLTSFRSKHKERIIFLGHRFTSSFKMHQEIKRNYFFKYQNTINTNYPHMAAYFRKFHSNFKSKANRIFKGSNPTISQSHELTFDSNFQSGNLDAAIKIGQNQYDLFLRIDSNTRGHLQWFNFTVKNCGKKKIRFNIVNFTKAKTLYLRGMKPYVYSEYLKQTKELNWFQGGQNVKYNRRKLMYDFLGQNHEDEELNTYSCLTFDYTFQVDWETVQFAYSPPFTYTDLMNMILKLKQLSSAQTQITEQPFIKEEVLCESLAGMEIPLLTITDPTVDSKKKRCILVSARIHPGQSCSSFMAKGLLEYICSDIQEAKILRKNVIFKVIPMINPDGVIIGNYRTSLCGRDLNRTFKMNNDFLIPQVKALKELVLKLKLQYKSKLMMFLDLHGHSVKKNVFLYGPEYQIWETNYYKTRMFPKLISNKTDMFRYYSCIFRIAEFKKATARAVILRQIPHCYTIQASAGFYYCPHEKVDMPFTVQKWTQMGRKIGQTLHEYLQILNQEAVMKEQRKQRLVSLKVVKNYRNVSKRLSQKYSSNKFQTRVITKLSNKDKLQQEEQFTHQPNDMTMSKKVRDIIKSIQEDQKNIGQVMISEGHQSDKFSQGGSDSQSQGQNLARDQLNILQDHMMDYLQDFRQKFYKEKPERQTSHKPQSQKKKWKDMQEIRVKRQSKGVQLIASLRKKAQQLQKGRQVIVWNKVKEEFKQLKHNKNGDHYFNPRSTVGRVQGIQTKGKLRMRISGLESQILEKDERLLPFRQTKFGK